MTREHTPEIPRPDPEPVETLDCIGLLCPLPVLRARKRLLSLPSGTLLDVQASDPMAAIDLPHFCTETGHHFLGATEGAGFTTYRIRRAKQP